MQAVTEDQTWARGPLVEALKLWEGQASVGIRATGHEPFQPICKMEIMLERLLI